MNTSARFSDRLIPISQSALLSFCSRLWLAAAAGSLLLSQAALAATFTVTSVNDGGAGSLREAITSANSIGTDDTIFFSLPFGTHPTIILNTALPQLNSNIAIINDRAGDKMITVQRSSLLGTPAFRIFSITPDHIVTIAGLTLTNGTGAIFNDSSTLTVRSCVLHRNAASDGNGGAIHNTSSDGTKPAVLTVRNSTLSENSSAEGFYLWIPGGGGLRNYAFGSGRVTANLSNCVLRQNSAFNGGGGIANIGFSLDSWASLSLTGCTLSDNSAGSGGGINNSGRADVTLTNCTLRDNFGSSGGGIRNDTFDPASAPITLTNCTLVGNRTNYSGGAVSNRGTLSLTNCTLSGNIAGDSSTSSAGEGGGGVYNSEGTTTLTNCTFAYNLARNDAVGQSVFNREEGYVLSRNTIFVRSGTKSNIFNNVFESAVFTSGGHNLSSDAVGGNSGTLPGGLLNASGDIRNTNPLLFGLANNGGPTETRALQFGSPAINAGDDAFAPARDQRGYTRSGVSDIGAFEFGGAQ